MKIVRKRKKLTLKKIGSQRAYIIQPEIFNPFAWFLLLFCLWLWAKCRAFQSIHSCLVLISCVLCVDARLNVKDQWISGVYAFWKLNNKQTNRPQSYKSLYVCLSVWFGYKYYRKWGLIRRDRTTMSRAPYKIHKHKHTHARTPEKYLSNAFFVWYFFYGRQATFYNE